MIVRAQSPAFLLSDPVIDLLKRAYTRHTDNRVKDVLAALLPIIHEPYVGAFVAEENGQLLGWMLVFLPTSPLHPYPQVSYLWNGGSNSLRQALLSVLVDYVTSNGYNKLRFINGSGRSDRAYARLVKELGPVRPTGSILELSLGQQEADNAHAGHIRRKQQQQQPAIEQHADRHDAKRVSGAAKPFGERVAKSVQRRPNLRRAVKRRRPVKQRPRKPVA